MMLFTTRLMTCNENSNQMKHIKRNFNDNHQTCQLIFIIHFQSLNESEGMAITSLPVPSESESLSQESLAISDNFLRFSCAALALFSSVLRLNLPVLVSGFFLVASLVKCSALVSGVPFGRRGHRLAASRLRRCSKSGSSSSSSEDTA